DYTAIPGLRPKRSDLLFYSIYLIYRDDISILGKKIHDWAGFMAASKIKYNGKLYERFLEKLAQKKSINEEDLHQAIFGDGYLVSYCISWIVKVLKKGKSFENVARLVARNPFLANPNFAFWMINHLTTIGRIKSPEMAYDPIATSPETLEIARLFARDGYWDKIPQLLLTSAMMRDYKITEDGKKIYYDFLAGRHQVVGQCREAFVMDERFFDMYSRIPDRELAQFLEDQFKMAALTTAYYFGRDSGVDAHSAKLRDTFNRLQVKRKEFLQRLPAENCAKLKQLLDQPVSVPTLMHPYTLRQIFSMVFGDNSSIFHSFTFRGWETGLPDFARQIRSYDGLPTVLLHGTNLENSLKIIANGGISPLKVRENEGPSREELRQRAYHFLSSSPVERLLPENNLAANGWSSGKTQVYSHLATAESFSSRTPQSRVIGPWAFWGKSLGENVAFEISVAAVPAEELSHTRRRGYTQNTYVPIDAGLLTDPEFVPVHDIVSFKRIAIDKADRHYLRIYLTTLSDDAKVWEAKVKKIEEGFSGLLQRPIDQAGIRKEFGLEILPMKQYGNIQENIRAELVQIVKEQFTSHREIFKTAVPLLMELEDYLLSQITDPTDLDEINIARELAVFDF
ncbi:MAG: hypothetical protein WC624_05655, partial [Candidatus Margulisiibacteriota bacterium]